MKKKILNNADNYEHLCTIKLTKDKFPIAFENKVMELMSECKMTRDEAEKAIPDMEIELELYYESGYGAFAVDSEAVEAGTIYSPYSKEEYCKADI